MSLNAPNKEIKALSQGWAPTKLVARTTAQKLANESGKWIKVWPHFIIFVAACIFDWIFYLFLETAAATYWHIKTFLSPLLIIDCLLRMQLSINKIAAQLCNFIDLGQGGKNDWMD